MQEYEEEMRSKRRIVYRNTESIYASDISRPVTTKEEFNYNRLTKLTGTIIYGDNSKKDALRSMYSLIKNSKRWGRDKWEERERIGFK